MPKQGDAIPVVNVDNGNITKDAEFTSNIQDQIEKLHKQLQKKEEIINKLQFMVAKNQT